MNVHLDEKTAEMVRELAVSQGMTESEVVQKIIEWYVSDCSMKN